VCWPPCELDRRHADAAAAALHQQRFTCLERPRSNTFDHTVKYVSGRLAGLDVGEIGRPGRH
jgi:hypothetical protein